jgi:heme/copper-type cytochrome/quinol oxidase subunit 3
MCNLLMVFFLWADILNWQHEMKQGVVLTKAIIGFFFPIVGRTS